jgi:hypothetical protein
MGYSRRIYTDHHYNVASQCEIHSTCIDSLCTIHLEMGNASKMRTRAGTLGLVLSKQGSYGDIPIPVRRFEANVRKADGEREYIGLLNTDAHVGYMVRAILNAVRVRWVDGYIGLRRMYACPLSS